MKHLVSLLLSTFFLLTVLTCAIHPSKGQPPAKNTNQYQDRIRPLLKKYCYQCHGDNKRPRGDLNLSILKTAADAAKAKAVWKEVHERLHAKDMPPRKRPQPTVAERKVLTAWLQNMILDVDLKGARDPGKPILRRLTRLEYNNAIRDLLGLKTDLFMFPERLPYRKDYFDAALRSGRMPTQFRLSAIQYGARMPALLKQAGLPGDSRAEHGFTNRGDALNLSPLLLEKYLAVATELLSLQSLPDVVSRHKALFAHLRSASQAPRNAKDLALVAAKKFAPRDNVHQLAESGYSLASVRKELVNAMQTDHGGVFHAEIPRHRTLRAGDAIAVAYGSTKTLRLIPDQPIWLANFATVESVSGNTIFTNRNKRRRRYSFGLEVVSAKKNEGVICCALVVLSRKGQRGVVRVTAEFSDGARKTLKASLKPGRGVANTLFRLAAPPKQTITRLIIDGDDFTGDYLTVDDLAFITAPRKSSPRAPTAALAQSRDSFKEHLTQFMARAFRRPVPNVKVEQYLRPFDATLKRGQPHHVAARASLTAVLASPEFLYVIEPVVAKKGLVRPLNDYELAARLSFFLWASVPDEPLIALASQGKLQNPIVLEQQTRRMLRDPKSRELTGSFTVQWLHLNHLWGARPDRKQFRNYYYGETGTLAQDMMAEAVLLFESVHVEDRSILDFIDARYAYLNQRLLDHYRFDAGKLRLYPADKSNAGGKIQLGEKKDNPWFRVQLPDRKRGGVLTTGAVLTLTSLPNRTSPVKRGAWILETIFNRPPPPPNVAVEPLDANPRKTAGKTVRQKLELHRTQATCIACHAKIDPPGFALESYDAVGRWRDKDGKLPVDASGEMVDGRKFSGLVEFKDILLAKKDDFVRAFIEHLLSYSLARKLEYFDEPTVQATTRAAAKDDYRLSRIVVEIVKSYPFRHVRNVRADRN